MPVSRGKLDDLDISVLRDTGCSGVVVRRKLVPPQYMTNTFQTCVLADGSSIRAPVAKFEVCTPFYTGPVEAWCMEKPVYDLLIGNIENARDPNNPDGD